MTYACVSKTNTSQIDVGQTISVCLCSLRMQSRYYLYYKLLAEQGTSDSSLPDVLQVLEAALEELAVCKDTQASCSTLLIRLCYLDTQTHVHLLPWLHKAWLFVQHITVQGVEPSLYLIRHAGLEAQVTNALQLCITNWLSLFALHHGAQHNCLSVPS